MILMAKIVVAVMAPVLLGTAGAAWVLSLRLAAERQEAVLQAAARLDHRAADLAVRLQARREALRLLAATPALRGEDGLVAQATLQAWAADGALFESLRFEPNAAAGSEPQLVVVAGPLRVDQPMPLPMDGARPGGRLVGSVALAGLWPPVPGGGPDPAGVRWLLLDSEGRPVAEPSAPGGRPAADALPLVQALPGPVVGKAGAAPVMDVALDRSRYKVLQAPVPGSGWQLLYVQPEPDFHAGLRVPVQRLSVWMVSVLALALLCAWWVRRSFVRPLAALAAAHARVQAGDLSVRAATDGGGEFAKLARSFNRMAEALDQAERKFRQVFEAFPHPVSLSRLPDGRLIDVNPAFVAATGRPREAIIGRNAVELGLGTDPQAIDTHSRTLLAQGQLDNLPITVTDAAGRRKRLLYSSRRLVLDGEPVALIVAIDITPMKEAEDRLRRSEQSFTALFESAPMPLSYSRRQDGYRFSIWNDAWFRTFGYPREVAHGHAGRDFELWVDDADRERYGDVIRHQGRVEGFEACLRHHDGSLHWYELSGSIINTADGALLMTAFADVTQLRQAVAAAQASEARLQAVFDASPVAMIVADVARDHVAVAANRAWYRQFLRRPEEVIGRSGAQMGLWARPDERKRLLAGLQHSGDDVVGFEAELVRGDGSHLLSRVAARRFRAGDDDLMILAEEDITEQVRSAQALQESRELLSHTFDLTPEPLAIVAGDDGRFLDVNRMWVQVIGVPREQVLGRTSVELGLWDDVADRTRIRERLAQEGRLIDMPMSFRLPAGGRILCEVSAVQMVWQGRPVGLWLVRDVTARQQAQDTLRELNETLEQRVTARTRELSDALDTLRRAQADLVHAEKLASLGSLVAGVAHELNTPIGNAVMVASTLSDHRRSFEAAIAGGLRRSALDHYLASAGEALQVLERNLHRAAELVGSFKQLAVDQSSEQRRHFLLAEVVQEVLLALSPTLRRSRVVLVPEVPVDLALDSYPGPVGQVLVNLITNALVHAFDPGAEGRVQLQAEPRGSAGLRLRVVDNGRGIPEADIGRVFDPFFTTRLGQGGSGLGLHIVYNLVTGPLGGRIEVRSQEGAGTEFVIDLPLQAPGP